MKSIFRYFSYPAINCQVHRASRFSTAFFNEDIKVHHLLNDIPIGKMSVQNLAEAKSLIFKWCDISQSFEPQRAEMMLNRLISEQQDGGNQLVHLPISIYVTLLEAFAKSGKDELSAHNLLQRMIQRRDELQSVSSNSNKNSLLNEALPMPDIACYNTVLYGWANSNHPLAIENMEKLIHFLEQNVEAGAYPQPNTSTYNLLINAYANRASLYGYAQKAEDILLQMANLNSQNQPHVRPNTTSFNIVLKVIFSCLCRSMHQVSLH